MKTIYTICILLLTAQLSFGNSIICPDPPINDSPCINDSNPPIDLTGGGSHDGTTCCATFDFGNANCSAVTEDASVWYMYTPNMADDGYNIILEPGDAEGPISIEIYTGIPEAGCSGALTYIDGKCNVNFADIRLGNCFTVGDVLFVKVTTNELEENCGTFILTILPAECGDMADNCIDLVDQDPIEPITNVNFFIDYFCVSGCLDYACPEDEAFGGCPEITEMPTVWFQVIADDIAAQMFTTIEPNGNWDPIWSVYSGPDCDNLTVVDFGGSPPCSNGDNTPDLHQTSVFDSEQNYWIMVTIDPNSLPASGLDDGSFELCVSTTINAIICLGELEGGACDDESLVMEITDREFDILPLDGPFCQGEEVTINISFFYDASDSGSDWLIGFVPTFGSGWDLSNFDYTANAPIGNGQTGEWYEEGGDCAPILQEPNPILCTYTDEEGNLQLCNLICSPCSECPQIGMFEGDPLPSGYFWVSNGGNAGCNNDCSPGEGWGIGSVQSQIDWTFTLKVKEFNDYEGCIDNKDLSISFQTFSDGSAGCWEDPVGECLLDRAMFSFPWQVACNETTFVTGSDQEICYNGVTDILVQTADGSTTTIIVEAIDNPFVTGEFGYTFIGGSGTIQNNLSNLTDDVQTVVYSVYADDINLPCPAVKSEFKVTIYPVLLGSFPPTFVCEGNCITITPDVIGGKPGPITYSWSTGETTAFITVCPTELSFYSVTIEDSNGCTSGAELFIDVIPETEDCIEIEQYKLIYDFFLDVNEDGIRDSLDLPFGEGSFFLDPNQTLYYNTSLEQDTLILFEGEYVLTFNPESLPDWYLTTDSIFTVNLDSINNCVKIEFGIAQVQLVRDVKIEHFLVRRCNTDQLFYLIAKNKGGRVESGILWTELDEEVLPANFPTNATIDTFISPNIVGWFFEGLLPGHRVTKTVGVHIPGPPDFPVGGILNHKIYVELFNNNGTTEIWEERDVSGNVQCGYDPNDKAVEPGHEEGYTNLNQEDLVFKIRFQNTGNDVALNIEIRDTLSEYFNLATIEYIGGSHDEFLAFSRVGDNVLIFDFDNINLPDSTSNFAGSQGFLIYRVYLKDELPEGTLIENTAHIYFDNNPAVVTNTTKNILYPDLDEDGFFSIEDCNEEDAAINPGAEEIPNNVVDEDCDGLALIIDNDMDGFNSDEDCDDENAAINPDAEEIINNDVDENCDNLVVIIDIDMDGFNSDEDCDDDNADINPDADEIPNNEVDEDCDGVALIIDNDLDGFNSDEDCDDDNADINPDADEIPNNEVDEDCDGEALIIDNDMDGFNSDEDCDDDNADINPDADEIPNNEVDEDCDGEALIIDIDMDGFNSDEDCDDDNADINPDADEIPNNEVDEDCDGEVLIIDNDMDGFNSDEDCDDDNADINPDAEDIPGNGIDEDCDGEDAVIIDVEEEQLFQVSITPNPSNDAFNITLNTTDEVDYIIRDVVGREVVRGKIAPSNRTVYLGMEPNGIYLMVLSSEKLKQVSFHKLLKI